MRCVNLQGTFTVQIVHFSVDSGSYFFYYFWEWTSVQLSKKFYLCPTLNRRQWQKREK